MPADKLAYYIVDFFVILAAVMVADYILNWFQHKRKRGLNYLYCDACDEKQITYKIPGRDYRLCKYCAEELFGKDATITEEQKEVVRAKYKISRRKRRPKK